MRAIKLQDINIDHDGEVNISIGMSRKETNWKNKSDFLWSEFVKKCSQTQRTNETLAEYSKSNKTVQSELKDVGGYVGGHISGGRRKADNITNRQLITLDVDHAPDLDFWENYKLIHGNAGLIYSTHSHSPSKPRYRLIIPASRPMFVDEFEAVSRMIANDLDINLFDDTTFEASRLMFWPSSSKDGEYVFEYNDGSWVDPDEILSRYEDWHNSLEWPVSDRVNAIVQREIKKQGDPLEKPGLIGAFCRCYDIHTAIAEFLQDDYEQCADPNRYTYKEGSTAAGLVIYEDKFAYSHHGTDPVSGKLCNAFDLVRIHKFGLKDEDAKEGTPTVKLPSYIAMQDYARNIPEVKKLSTKEKLQNAMDDFDDLPEEETNLDWAEALKLDKKNNIQPTISNIHIILENDPRLKGKLSLDTFRNKPIITGDLPWRRYKKEDDLISDTDISGLRMYIEEHYDINKTTKLEDALALVTEKHKTHPVQEYLLKRLPSWDGKKRAESLFIDYLGAADAKYTRAVTRKMLAGAVMRILHPGCKFDYIVVLVGKQGIGKSSLIRKIGMDWFSDSLVDLKGKEAYQQLQGVWLMEMAELSSLKKTELETAKHFATKQTDEFRPPYGHHVIRLHRQTVFVGTTNNKDFLRDPTGNRRFWPVDAYVTEPAKSWSSMEQSEIDQIWAEALEFVKNCENLYLEDELEKEAVSVQLDHTEADERAGQIEEFLNLKLPSDWSGKTTKERRTWLSEDPTIREAGTALRDRVCIPELWCEALDGDLRDVKKQAKDLHNIMKNIDGWELSSGKLRNAQYGILRTYIRKENHVALNE